MQTPVLSDSARAKLALSEAQFHFSRALGQNFLLDDAWNREIARLSGVEEGTNVLEIGPGAGTLTCALAREGAHVLAVEIDTGLKAVLDRMLAPFPQVQVRYGDIMKESIPTLIDDHFGPDAAYQVVANLPYAITAELLPRLVASRRAPSAITAMVQKEAAERMCAQPGEKNWCALAARMQYFSTLEIVHVLPPHAFTPNAHVESALIHCRHLPAQERPAQPLDEGHFLSCIDAAFAMRRKTYANNLSAAFSLPREQVVEALAQVGIAPTIRGEVLTLPQIAAVSDALPRTHSL